MADTAAEGGLRSLAVSPALARVRAVALSWPVVLALILLLGGYLRFHGLRWDQASGADEPQHLHPDERFLSITADHLDWPGSVGAYFDTARSPLNPYNDPETHSFVYGTFPLFLAKGVAAIADDDGYDTTVIWGRRLAALFDTATIALVFGAGALLFGRWSGLAGALLYALAVLPTQLAHFWTVDPFLSFFGASMMLLGVLLVRARGMVAPWFVAVGLGLALGLAAACKINGLLFLAVPVVAAAARIGLRDLPGLGLLWRGERRRVGGHWLTETSLFCLVLAVGLVAFRIAQPYAFSGPHFWDMSINPTWRDDIKREWDFQNGDVAFPPFIQFAGRTPIVTPLRNIVLFGLGPALGLAAFVSIAAAGVALFRRRDVALLLPLAAAVPVLAFQGIRFVAFMRYFAPAYPALCLLAGWGCAALWGMARKGPAPGARWRGFIPRFLSDRRFARTGAAALLAVVFATTAWWAFAFQAVYGQEHSRLQASRWVYENVRAGAAVTYELWDDPVPMDLPGRLHNQYRFIETEPYNPDSPQKVRELVYGRPGGETAGGLDQTNYVAITSNRIRDSVRRLERTYSATIRYYELLESGALGFQRVATFTVHPTFLGISIDDSGAEESFTVYDHPEVRIYRKTAAWDPERAVALLEEARPERAVALLPRQGRTNGLHFTAEQAVRQQAGGTFNDVFDAGGWASHAPWLWWLLWLELAAFASLPWITLLFRALPDRGYGLSKLLGLASVVLAVWLLVAWGAADFSGRLVWAAFAFVLLTGFTLGVMRRDGLRAEFRERWPAWLAAEAVFLAAFAGFLALRYWNPDLWHHPQGGEKPMELAYLTAVARSTELPPYDPWFGGGSMNYYYMGWFFLAVPIRALKLVPEVAFNMGVPTFAALAASVAFSTVHNLVGLARAVGQRAADAPKRWAYPAILTGAVGALFLVGMGNLDGGHQLIERLQSVNHWGLFEGVPVLGGAVGIVGGLYRWLFESAPLAPFDWWRSSRVHISQIDITEFPYWSFLFADLHPHLMGLPFFGLVIALAVAYVASAAAGLRRHGWVLAAVLGVALGLERTVHTWDFPTAVLIVGAAVVLGQVLAPGRWQTRWWFAVAHLTIAATVLTVAFAPFTSHFETFDPGIHRAEETTKPYQYFAQFGLFLCFGLAFIAVRYHEERRACARRPGRNMLLAIVNGRLELAALAVFTAGLAVFTWRLGLTVVAVSILLELFLVNLCWLELRAPERNVARLLATALYVLAFGIAAGVDVVTLNNDIERMNTVFKFGLQAWQLFALASAFAGWYVGSALWKADRRWLRPRPGRGLAAWTAAGVAVVLVGGSAVFLWSGTKARQEARFADLSPTFDGLAYLRVARYVESRGTYDNTSDDVPIVLADDEPLIRWLRENVEGSPVIAEAVGPLYSWTNRIANNTGLPAVVGWDWHQVQQRTDYASLVEQRRADTKRFFSETGTEFAEQYLRKYNVSYVVVGTEERVYGSAPGLAKLAQMPALTEVFRSGPNAIYRVDQAKLAP